MDRIEANQAIATSLETWVGSLKDQTEGQGAGMLGDWMAVVCMVAVNDDGLPVAQYYVAMKDGAMLPHVAEGLLRRGLADLGDDDELD